MNYYTDAKNLVDYAAKHLHEIRKAYAESLHDKEIKPQLTISIKNLMENLRSALDFVAHGLYDAHCLKGGKTPNIYFPYAWQTLSQADFRSRGIVESRIPGLSAVRPDIVAKIEGYQHFASASNEWFPLFMDLNNENKHQQLTPQTRTETKQLNIQSGGARISIGEGARINLGPGTFIRIGDSIIQGNQRIDTSNPARISGPAQQTLVAWVDFQFTSNGRSVIPLLESALNGVRSIVEDLSGS